MVAMWRLPVTAALDRLISLVVITVLFALIFKYLPGIAIAWRDAWVGAAITALLFVGKFGTGPYLGTSEAFCVSRRRFPYRYIGLDLLLGPDPFLPGRVDPGMGDQSRSIDGRRLGP